MPSPNKAKLIKPPKNIATISKVTGWLTIVFAVIMLLGLFSGGSNTNVVGDAIGLVILLALIISSILLLKSASTDLLEIKKVTSIYILPLMIVITLIVVTAGGGFALLPFLVFVFDIYLAVKVNKLVKTKYA